MRRPNIQEFILISKDSDFVPVLQRLRERKRKTTVLVDESKPAIYTTYAKTADLTFPLRRLMGEGRAYQRIKPSMFERLGWGRQRATPPLAVASTSLSPLLKRASPAVSSSVSVQNTSSFDVAVEKIVAVAARNGGQSTGRQSVTKELRTVPGFSSNGIARYFGHGSYETLVRAVAARDARIVVRDEKGGGMSLIFVGIPSAPSRSDLQTAERV